MLQYYEIGNPLLYIHIYCECQSFLEIRLVEYVLCSIYDTVYSSMEQYVYNVYSIHYTVMNALFEEMKGVMKAADWKINRK